MANMSSISCATTCGRRLPVSARKGSRAAPSATRDGASYPQYAFQAAAISGFTSRVTQQLIGRATERAAAVGADVRLGSSATEALEATRPRTSASLQKPTSERLPCYVRLVPKADICGAVKCIAVRSPHRRLASQEGNSAATTPTALI